MAIADAIVRRDPEAKDYVVAEFERMRLLPALGVDDQAVLDNLYDSNGDLINPVDSAMMEEGFPGVGLAPAKDGSHVAMAALYRERREQDADSGAEREDGEMASATNVVVVPAAAAIVPGDVATGAVAVATSAVAVATGAFAVAGTVAFDSAAAPPTIPSIVIPLVSEDEPESAPKRSLSQMQSTDSNAKDEDSGKGKKDKKKKKG